MVERQQLEGAAIVMADDRGWVQGMFMKPLV